MDWSLPAELAAGTSVRGEEYGWEIACFPPLATAERLKLGLPGRSSSSFDSTTQVYGNRRWLSADPTGGSPERHGRPTFIALAQRGRERIRSPGRHSSFSVVVRDLPSDLRDKATADGVDPTRVLVFVAYFVTEPAFVDLSVTKR